MSDAKVSINTKEYLKPKSLNDYKEYNISSYCKENYKKFEFLKNGIDFAKWWAPKGGKLPTWDLISICDINNQSGLLLVEAKAHKSELTREGKKNNSLENSNSDFNHKNIEACIKESNKYLPDFKMSINSHYQLSNRISSAWKLTTLGIPVILLYIGFTEDKYFNDHFIDNNDWKKEFNKYISGIVPTSFINNSDSKSFLFFERSINVIQ
jgi:hypothetical protein